MTTSATIPCKRISTFLCTLVIALGLFTSHVNAQQASGISPLTPNTPQSASQFQLVPEQSMAGCNCSSFTVCITAQTNVSCNGGNTGSATASASGGSTPYSYSWNTNPVQKTATASNLSPGTYTVTATDDMNCTATACVIITQGNKITLSIPACAAICKGSCTTLKVSGSICTSYTWSPSAGLSATTGSSVNACPTVTTTYTVTGTESGCTGTATVVVTVNPSTTITIPPASICLGSCATLTVSGSPCANYTWSPSTGLSATTGSSVSACPTATTTYTVTGPDKNGCPATGTVVVTVNPSTTITIPPATICYGSCATLTISGAPCTGYTWSPSTGLSATTGSSVSACPTTTTTYTVTGPDHNGCSARGTVVVTVNPTTTITIPPATICYGSCATLTISGAPCTGYTWSPSTGLSATTGSSVSACPTTTTTYTVTGPDHNGCSARGTVVVTVNPTTTITIPPATICYGSCATLTISGAPCTGYTWSPSTGLSATTGSSVSACPTTTTTYTVTGPDHNGCSATGKVVVTVNPLPTISVPGATVCYGNCAALTASGAVSYSWSPSKGLSATTGAIVNACPTATTTYTITGTNANNCTSTTTTVVSVNPLPTISVPGATVCYGNCAALTASGAVSYTWSPANGLSATTGAIVRACPTATTTYTITGTNANNCTSTTTAIVNVNPNPSISVPPATICYGNCAALTASGAASYTWSPANGLSATTGAIVNACPTATTTYTITGTNGTNCTATTTAVVTVNPLPTLSITAKLPAVCSGNPDTLTASGATTYTWSPSAGLNVTTGAMVIASPTVNTTYTVTGTNGTTNCVSIDTISVVISPAPKVTINVNPSSVCSGNPDTLLASGAMTYIWSPSAGLSATSGSEVIATPTVSTTYDVVGISNAGCESLNVTIVPLTVNPKPTISVPGATVCYGNCAALTASGAVTYTWSPATGLSATTGAIVNACPTATTTYTIIGTNSTGCTDTTTSVVRVNPLPIVSVPPASVCIGNCAALTASGATTYTWSPATALSATTGAIVNACPEATTTYTVTGTNGNNCTSTTTVVVTVNPLPVLTLTAKTPSICIGGSDTITASGATSYTWSPAAGLNTTTGAVVIATPTITTKYKVVGVNANGCVCGDSITITVNQLPVINVPPAAICYGSSAALTASGASTYTWSPANGLSATTGAIVTANPTATTTYTIVGTNQNGCVATTTTTVTVNPLPTISVPGATVCYGNCAALTASGAVSYTWSPATGLSATTGAIVSACPTATTTYTIIGTNGNNCTSYTRTVVNVNSLPQVSVPGATVCYGNCAALTASGAASYTWSPATGLSATTGAIVNACPTATTTYTITGTNANNCTSTTTAVVFVNPLPTLSVPGATVCYGNCAALTAAGAVSYTWSPATGLSATTGAIVNACPTATTTYTITGTNASNCTSTTTAVVTVNPLPTISVPPATVCYGNCAALTASGAVSYTWSPATGLSATTGAIVSACPTATTTYTITGTNANNCTSYTTTVVNVNTLPIIAVPPATICNGNSTALTASGATTYTWSPATGLSATTGSSVIATPTLTTTYTVTGANGNNCSNSTTVVVTVDTLPNVAILGASCSENNVTVSQGGWGTTCHGGDPGCFRDAHFATCFPSGVTIGCNGGNTLSLTSDDTVSEFFPQGTAPSVLPSGAMVDNLSYRNIFAGQLVAAELNVGFANCVSGYSGNIGNLIIASGKFAGLTVNQLISISNQVIGGCSTTYSPSDLTDALDNVNGAFDGGTPSGYLTCKGALCVGSSDTLIAVGANSYAWSPSTGLNSTVGSEVIATPSVTTTYTVIGTNSNSCTDTASVVVTVNPLPTISVPPATVCYGNCAALTASGASTYTWSPATGLSATTGAIVNACPTITTTYTIIGTSANNCTSSTTTVVTVTPKTILSLKLKNDTVCAGASVTFTVGAAGSNLTYTWQFNGVTIGSQSSTSYTIPSVTLADSGVYTVIVSGACGNDTSSATLKVNSKPVITIQPKTNIMCAVNGQCGGHEFCVTATGVNISYQWYFRGNLIPGATERCYAFDPGTFADTGKYFVIVSNQCGADTSDTAIFILINSPVVSVPSAAICYGNCASLTASGASTYTWSPAIGLSGTTGAVVNACPTTTTTYTVIGTGLAGCTDTTITVVTVNPNPSISVPPATICYGNCAALTASGAASYTWSPANGLSATTGAIVNACPTATTTYTITGTNGTNCTATTTAVVTVNPLPTLSITAKLPAVCSGNPDTLTASGATTYTWSPSAGLNVTTGAMVIASPTVNTTYTVTGTNGTTNCVSIDTISVVISPAPKVTINVNPSSVCSGNPDTLLASGAMTYIWSPSAGLSATSGSEVIATPTVSTTYDVVGISNAGCESLNVTIVPLTVNPKPTISVPGATVCYGNCAALTASGAVTYTWSPATGLSATTGAIVNACPTATTTYTIIGTNSTGCTDTTTSVVRVNPLPIVSVPPASVCIGNCAALTASGATTYTWSPATALSATTGAIVNACPEATTTYTVTGTNGNNCTSTTTVVVTVNPLPVLTLTAKTPSICIGGSDTITASGATSYTWSPAAGLNTTTGAVVIATPTITTKYKVVGVNANGCVCGDSITITVNQLPVINVPPAAICYGSSAALTASGASTYTWSPANGLSATTGAIVTANPTATTTYTIVGTNQNGCVATTTTTVTVNPLPTISVPGATVCYGNCAALTASGAVSYTWSPATGLSATTGAIVSACPTATTTYTIIGTNGNNCTSYTRTVVNVNSLPQVSVPGATVCYGNCAALTASGAASYTWSPATGLSATTGAIVNACPTATTTYTITGTNANNCTSTTTAVVFVNPLPTLSVPGATVCYGNCAALTAAGAVSYTWSPATGLSATTGAIVNACPTATTTYTITGTNASNCTSTTTAVVTVNPLPTISVPPATVCYGNCAALTASGAVSYTWSPATGLSATTGAIVSACPTATTTYTITGTNANNCTSSTTTVVTVTPTTVLTLKLKNDTVCAGANVVFTVGATGSNLTYTWFWNWTILSGHTSDTLNIPSVSLADSGLYSVIVSGTCGNDTSSATLKVNSKPVITRQPKTNIMCAVNGQCGGHEFCVTATGVNISYQWYFRGNLIPGATSSCYAFDPGTFADTGKYFVIVSNQCGADTSDTAIFVLINSPVISVPSAAICYGNCATLTASGASTYTWSPATGLSATTGAIVNACPTATTTYTVIGTGLAGCTDTTITVVTVNPNPSISVPPATICYGYSAALTASGAATYTWSPATGLSATTGAIVIADPTATTTYTIIGANQSGCSDTTTTTVTVHPKPSISVPPATVCYGNCATLQASGLGEGGTYTWSVAGGESTSSGPSIQACPTATTTYTIIGTNNFGCSDTVTTTVTVNPLPSVSVPPATVCYGNSAILTASGATSYTWKPATGLNATTGAVVTATPSATTTYTIIGTNGFECVDSTTTIVTVNPLPSVSVPPATVCYGNSAILTASGATSYTWKPSTGLSATTGSIVTATPAQTTTYTVIGTNGFDCVDSTTTVVTVNPLPTISVPGATVCYGNSATLTASGAVSYTWSPANGLSATTGAIVTATPATTTTYTITGTNANNCTSTTTTVVTVNPLPIVSVPGATVCYGNSATLTASGAVSYTWSPANGLSATTGAIVTATPIATTTYTITGTNANNCTSTTTTVVTVDTLPAIVLTESSPSICVGSTDTLRATGATSYTWKPQVHEYEGLPYVTVNPTVTTTYTVIGTNGNGCVDSSTIVVVVNPLPTVTVPPATICYGYSAALTASGATSYTWSPSGSLSASTGAVVIANPTVTTSYTVIGTNASGCSDTTTTTVTVHPKPSISVPPATVCYGNCATLQASGLGEGGTYTWHASSGEGTSTGATVQVCPIVTTTYTIIGTNNFGCSDTTTTTVTVNPLPSVSVPPATVCYGNSATLTASGATSYTWKPATGLSATTGAVVTATPSATTTYTIIGTNGFDCVDSTTTVVTVNPLPIVSVPPASVCIGDCATLTASGATSYTWSPATALSATTGAVVNACPRATTTYTVTGTNGNDCVGTTTVVVTVNPLPVVTLTAKTPSICIGGSDTITASGATTYIWSPATGLSATTGAVVIANPTVTTTYHVIGINANGCVCGDSITITVNPLPTVTVPPATVCYGYSAALTASGAATYTWSPATGLSATTGAIVIADPTATTTYTIIGANQSGCSDTTTTTVTVHPKPSISVPPATVCYGNCATLQASGLGEGGTYTWSVAGGESTSSGPSIQACPTATTTYTIIGTNNFGCSDTVTTTVTVNPLPSVSVPPATVCYGNSAILTASGATSYTWKPATGLNATTGAVVTATPSATTTYTIIGTNGFECVDSTTTIVTVNPLPSVSVPPATVCYGNSAILTASGATSYTWKPSTGLSATTGSIVTATPAQTTTYTVIGTNGFDCVDSTTTVVTVNPLPTISVPGATVCYGNSATLTASGAVSYTWSPANGLSATTGAIVTATPATTTTYTITGTNANNCTSTTTTVVTVNPLPIVSVPGATVCYGNSATLTASGAVSYTWSPANGLSATTGAIVTATPIATTTYTITGTNANNCTSTTTTVVTVDTLPAIVLTESSPSICVGSTDTLRATGATSYTWKPQVHEYEGLPYVTVNPTVTTTYTVIGTNGNGCVDSSTIVVVVNPLPTVTVPPATICYGYSAALTASGATSYTWSPSGSLSASTGAVVIANPTVTTSYTVIGTNASGCSDTTTTTVTVHPKPSISVPPATVCYGNCATLQASGLGEGGTYTWHASSGEGTSTGATVQVCPIVTTTYTIIGTNNFGCSDTTTTTVTVNPLPSVSVPPATVCYGNSATLTASGATSYTWKPATGLSATTGAVVTATPSATTTYTIIGTNGFDCVDSTTTVVTVNPLPIVSVPPASVCIGDCATLTASGATSYTWSPATALSATTGAVVNACPRATTTYTVTGTNGNDCVGTTTVVVTVNPLPVVTLTAKTPSICIGGSDTITASGATTYIWSPATGLSATTGAVVIANPTVTTTYHVIGINANGCVCGDSITITVNPLPTVTVPPATVCYGYSAALTASGAATYTWSPATGLSATTGAIVIADPTATTTYTIIGANQSGCSDTTTTTVTVNPLPSVTVPPATICYGSSTVLTASGASSYTWSPATGLSATTGAVVAANPTATTTYTVIGANKNGCADTTTTIVTVHPKPTITVPPATICYGNCATLQASGLGENGTYVWTASNGVNPSEGTTLQVCPTVTTTYTIIGTNSYGCSDTTTTTVTVDTLPTITLTETSPSICVGSTDTLRASGSNGYTWKPEVREYEGLPYVTVNPTVTTTYTVIGTNNNGCEDSATIVVTVNPLPTVSVPPASVCYGNSAVLTASGASSYTWSPATGLSATTGAIVTATPAATTTYTVVGTNESGCTDTTTTIVTVNPKPTIVVETPSPICNGNGILLTATGAGEDGIYTWSPATGLSATTGSSVVASPTVTTTYTVVGAYTTGCADTTTVVVTVLPTTTIVTQLNNDTVCVGASASFTVSATGNDLTYTWQHNGVTLSGRTSDTLDITTTASTDSGTYSVIVTGTCGIDTSTANLKVNSAPAGITLDVNDSTINNGQNYTLSLCANAGQPLFITLNVNGTDLTFQWQKDGVNISGAAEDTFTIQNVTITDTGAYRVIVTGPCGADTSALVDLLINNNPIVVAIYVNDEVVTSKLDTISECAGNEAVFSVTATGTGLTYQWQKNGVNIPEATSSTYTIDTTVHSDGGLYDVIVTGTCGADTAYARLKIHRKPRITSPPSGVTECLVNGVGDAVSFCVQAKGHDRTYQWYHAGKLIPGATDSCYTISHPTLADTGGYHVVVSNECGADTSRRVRLILYNAPCITSQPVCLSVCSGSTATFCVTATGSDLTYQWQFNGKNIIGANSSCYTIPSVTAWNAGCYDVVVSNSCGSVTSHIATLTITTPPVITCQPKGETLCSFEGKCGGSEGVTFCVTATGNNLSYQWQYNGHNIYGAHSACYTINPVTLSNAGCYDVIVSNSCGSDTSHVAVLTIGSSPVITSQPVCLSVCSGSTATFCVTAEGSDLSYQWQFNGKNIKGANSSCYTINSAAACNAGCYDVVVSNSCGSVTSHVATLAISTPPSITCQPQGQSLCSVGGKCGGNEGVTFCVTATGSNLSYQWQYNGHNIYGAHSSCYTINPVSASNAGCYDVIVSNSCGSDTSHTATLTIGSSPVITSQPVCASVCSGSSATFCVTATGSNLTYQWQFNGKNIWGANSSCYTINSAATCNAGCYDVVVSNSCGSVTSHTATLAVSAPPCITGQPVCEIVCAGSSTTFCVTASGSDLSYQWKFNDENIHNATSCCYTISSASSGNAGYYSVVVSNSCNSITSNYVTLTVNNCQTCEVPTNLKSCNITCTGATLSWSYQSSAKSFTVEYKASGCSTWSTETVSTNSLTLNCLKSGTTYEWSVSENCSCGSSSGYASVVEFCTSNNCCNNNNDAPRGDGGSGSSDQFKDVTVYPNPTFSLTTLHATFEKQSDVTVVVTDLTGRILMTESETAPVGEYIHQFDMSKQQAGTYFLIIRSGDQMVTSKIVKIE